MPWRSVKHMEERIRFVSDNLINVFPFIELCERSGIRRKTGYKRVGRYVTQGARGLGIASAALATYLSRRQIV